MDTSQVDNLRNDNLPAFDGDIELVDDDSDAIDINT